LQMIPLPLPGSDTNLPLEAWISHTAACGGLSENRNLPFRHVISDVDPQWLHDPVRGGQETLSLYREMRVHSGLRSEFTAGARRLPPYNLLLTRNWIMFVPRCEAPVVPAEVNALGFVGVLLARDNRELRAIRDSGPLTMLEKAGLPRNLG
jgi:ATP adenylyltransferase